MSHYAIGDLQGCLQPLQALLSHIGFNPGVDTLWFAGDLINRGPQSLATLQFIMRLESSAQVVLGNHDLHALGVYAGSRKLKPGDTIADIIQAPDATRYIDWLRAQPLVRSLPWQGQQCGLLVHAGIWPTWSFNQALELGTELQQLMAQANWPEHLARWYGNFPDQWDNNGHHHGPLNADQQLVIVNICTRMRMLSHDMRLDFFFKRLPVDAPIELQPWFCFPRTATAGGEGPIVFGHWSALKEIQNPLGYCLDTGCVWGGRLTALCLDDGKLYSVPGQVV